jgi:cbb3-type cytochrome oxidase subunit 3
MPVNQRLTLEVMILALIAAGLFIFFLYNRNNSEQEKYYHFDDDEKDALIELMSISLTRKTPLEEWKEYLVKLGVTETQFNELLEQVQNKILNP